MPKYICYPVRIESTGEIRLFNYEFDQSNMMIEDKILDDIYFKLDREGDYTVLDLFYSDADSPEMVAEDYFATELRKHIQNIYFVGDEYIQQPDKNTIFFEFEANLYTVKLVKVRYDWLEGRIHDYYYQVYSYQDGMKSKELVIEGLFTGFDFSAIDELVWGEFDLEIPKFNEGGLTGDLHNSKKGSIFVKRNRYEAVKNILSGNGSNGDRATIEAAASYIIGSEGAGRMVEKSINFKEQEKKLRRFADENNLWVKRTELGDYFNEGAEQSVYLLNGNYVTKTNNCSFYNNSWLDYFNNLLLHNHFFPSAKYDLIGFIDIDGHLHSVVKQPFIKATKKTDVADVNKFMTENGFVNLKGDDYYNPELGIIVEDLHDENVLTKDGVLYFIDTVFYIVDNLDFVPAKVAEIDNNYFENKFADGGEIKETYELTEENAWKFEYDLKNALGLDGVKNYHVVNGNTIVRIKGHSPNWENFVNDLELNENIDRIINVTVGDYNRRRFDTGLKTKLDEIESRYPDIDFVDIEINDGDDLDLSVAYVRHILYPEMMFSLGGNVRFNEGGEVTEPTRAEKIKQKVEQHLIESEKRRKVKDVGRVEMSRKQQAAYRIISMSNIDELNDDEVLAFNMVKKDAIWPPINVEEQKNQGVSAGAAYIKVKIREALPSKPANSSDKRKAYVNFLNILQTDLMELKTVKQVKDKVAFYLDPMDFAKTIKHFLYPNFDEAEENETSIKYFLNKYEIYSNDITDYNRKKFAKNVILDTLGKTFYNMISVGSEAAEANWKQAETYQQSEGDEEEYIKKVRERQQRSFDFYRDANKEIAVMDSEQFYKYLSARTNKVSRKEFMSRGGEEGYRKAFEREWNKAADKLKAEVEVPLIHRKRDDDWSWAIKKEKEEVQGEEDLKGRKVNTKEPLAYIKRVNGYKTPEPTPQNVVDYYGFSAYNFGKYVPDNERAEHAKHFIGAITDLAEILNIDIKQVHQLGKLGFGVGLKGHAGHLAAYYPQTKDINLVRGKGDGSVAHEWGHFFDNLLCDLDMKVAQPNFASEGDRIINDDENEYLLTEKFRAFDRFLHRGLSGSVNYKKRKFNAYKGKDWTGKISILSNIDLSLQTFFANYPSLEKWTLSKRSDERVRTEVLGWIVYKHGLDSYEIPLRIQTSYLVFDSSQIGSEYWVKKVELFARCFETYIFNKLAKANMANNYLAHDNYFSEGTPYPKGEELEYITTLFDEIIVDFKKLHNIGDFKPVIDERIGEEIIELQKDSVMPKVKAELNENDSENRMRMLALKAKADADALALLELEMEMQSGG